MPLRGPSTSTMPSTKSSRGARAARARGPRAGPTGRPQLGLCGADLRFALDPRGLDVRTVPIAAPTREAKSCSTSFASIRAPSAGMRPSSVRASSPCPRVCGPPQLDILRPTGPAPDKLAATLARLAALVGPENVGAPATVDTWREEAIDVKGYAGPAPPGPPTAGAPSDGTRLSIRRRRPPEGDRGVDGTTRTDRAARQRDHGPRAGGGWPVPALW